jgi:hypothetical protein
LGARALYSPLKIADMIDPAVKGAKTAVEQHHLFPRGYLTKIGIRANLARLESEGFPTFCQ